MLIFSFFMIITVLIVCALLGAGTMAINLYYTELKGLLLGNGVQPHNATSSEVDSNLIYLVDENTRCVHVQCHTSSISPFDDTTKIIKAIHAADRTRPLRLVVSTDGGSMIHCQQIVRWLRLHPSGFVVYCNEAYSAGTLVSISADELVMSNYSLLGKIDPIIGGQEEIIYRSFYRPPCQQQQPECNNGTSGLFSFDYNVKRAVATLNTAEKIIRESVPRYEQLAQAIKTQLLYSELRHWTSFNIDEVRQMGFNVREPYAHELEYFGYFQAK